MEDESFLERHGAAVGLGLGLLLVAMLVGIVFASGWLTPPQGGNEPSPAAGAPTSSAGASPSDEPASSPNATPAPTGLGTPDTATPTPASATPDPAPSGSPAATAPANASPPVTPDPGSPAAPTEPPTTTPTPASPTPVSPPPAVAWIEATDFPTYRGGTSLESIVAGGPGFVAVGNSGRQLRGRVWTSADGVRWTAQADDQFRGFHLDFVVRAGDGLYLLGGNRDGRRAWQSGNGRAWTEIGPVTGLDGGVNDVARANGTFIAVGWAEDDSGDQTSAVWRSTDGAAWQRVGAPDGIDELWEVEAKGSTLVAFPRWPILRLPLVVYSTDLGDSWQVARTDVGVSEDFNIGLVGVAANNRRFVIVGYHELDEYVPLVLTSRDGSQWTSATLTHPGFGFHQVVPLRGGDFLALGSGAHVTSDGSSWRDVAPVHPGEEPPRPPEGGDEVVTFRELASGRGGVVVAEEWGDSVRVWFGPLSLFE